MDLVYSEDRKHHPTLAFAELVPRDAQGQYNYSLSTNVKLNDLYEDPKIFVEPNTVYKLMITLYSLESSGSMSPPADLCLAHFLIK